MATFPNIVVLGHHSRRERAEHLALTLGAVLLMDDADRGAWAAHKRALEYAAHNGRTVVVEDDALPVPGFTPKAEQWITERPMHLLSFYLGTGHPRDWQAHVDTQWGNGTDLVRLPKLIHGVCYTVPPVAAGDMLDVLRPGPADFTIGDAYRAVTGLDVLYPKASLVDHDDGPSIANPGKPRQARRARQLDKLHTPPVEQNA